VWAEKALKIDPSLSDAHGALALKAFRFDYDWKEAERRFSLALSCAPVPVWTWLYTLYKLSLGRAREAEELIRGVVEADPLAALHRFILRGSSRRLVEPRKQSRNTATFWNSTRTSTSVGVDWVDCTSRGERQAKRSAVMKRRIRWRPS
jgi:hypothetical protein